MPDSDHRRWCRLFHPERHATHCARRHTRYLNAPLRTTRQSTRRRSSSWAKPELRGLPCVICERQKREGKGGMRVKNVSVHGTVCVVCAYQLCSILPPHCLLLLPCCSHWKNPSCTSQPAASNRAGYPVLAVRCQSPSMPSVHGARRAGGPIPRWLLMQSADASIARLE